MSKKILNMPVKAACVDADIITIVDSADSNIHTMNKQATIASLNKANYQTPVSNAGTTPSISLGSTDQNKRFRYTNPLTSLTFTGNISSGTYETEIQFTTDSTFTLVEGNLAGNWVGGTPTFSPNTRYVIAIKNGIAACGEVS